MRIVLILILLLTSLVGNTQKLGITFNQFITLDTMTKTYKLEEGNLDCILDLDNKYLMLGNKRTKNFVYIIKNSSTEINGFWLSKTLDCYSTFHEMNCIITITETKDFTELKIKYCNNTEVILKAI